MIRLTGLITTKAINNPNVNEDDNTHSKLKEDERISFPDSNRLDSFDIDDILTRCKSIYELLGTENKTVNRARITQAIYGVLKKHSSLKAK